MQLPTLLSELLSLPTAAFAESAVLEYIEDTCARLPGVTAEYDEHGNLLARYRHRPRNVSPLVFTAHTDHPGFVALEMTGPRRLRAAFRGWVEPEYFDQERARFWSGERWVKARITRLLKTAPLVGVPGRTGRPEEVELETAGDVEPGAPGMWDLPDPALREGLVYARGCDDVAGAAGLLAMLERLSLAQARADVHVLFTRAEEVGFVGAIAAARSRTIPRRLPVIAIETSKALPSAPIGEGPILRVGDKTSVFTPAVTAFCDRVAKELAQHDATFAYQRKLMDGGTCESTAYIAYGYAATGICIALGNYHNMDTQARRIASEYVSLSDWQRMVNWFEALALDERGFGHEDAALRDSLDKRFEGYRPLLAGGAPARVG